MDFSFSEEQREIAGLAERIFGERATVSTVAAAEVTPDAVDSDLWKRLADAGLLGLTLPEAYGGAGFGMVELALLLEQQGRRVAPVPLLPTLVAASLIADFGAEATKGRVLPSVADGSLVLTSALDDAGSRDPYAPATTAVEDGEVWLLTGRKLTVPAAHLAARVLVPAVQPDGQVGVFSIDPKDDTVAQERAVVSDRSVRPHLTMTATSARRLGGAEVLRALVERTTVGLCAIAVGVAAEATKMTAAYTSERVQFGRALASFQAVPQRVADAYIDSEAMRVSMWQAAWRLASGLDAEREVAVAKWWAACGGHRAVHAAQHLHGGLGADIDYPIHRYFLWGMSCAHALGGASEQAARLGARLAADARKSLA